MRCCKLLLAAAIMVSAQDLWSQGPPPSLPTDTLKTRKENVFRKVKDEHVNYFLYKDDNNARADKMYGRWENHWIGRLYYGAPSEEEMFTTYNFVMKSFFEPRNPYQDPDHTNGDPKQPNLSNTMAQRCVASYPAHWKFDGPNYDNWGDTVRDNAGQATYIWVDPSNNNHILLGSFASGLWETFNEGRNWANITDNSIGYTWGPIGVGKIAVQPGNTNLQYFSTEYRKTTAGLGGFYGYGRGLFFRSMPGGQFLPDLAFRERMRVDGHFDGGDRYDLHPRFLAFSPSSGKLYATYNRDFYVRSDFSSTNGDPSKWQKISLNLPIESSYQILAGAFSNVSPGKLALMTNTIGKKMYLITYEEGMPFAEVKAINNPYIDSIPADATHRYNSIGVRSMEFSYGSDQLFFTSAGNTSKHFYKINAPFGSSPTINFYSGLPGDLFVFKLHPHNPNLIYFGNTQGYSPLHFSMDGGTTIVQMNKQSVPQLRNPEGLHADIRHINLHAGTDPTGRGDVLYIATDGGISKKNANDVYVRSLSGAGLDFSLCYDLSVSETNSVLTVSGMQDTEGAIKMESPNGGAYWKYYDAAGDGLFTAISKNGKDYIVNNNQSGISYYGHYGNNTVIKNSCDGPPLDTVRAGAWERPTKFDWDNNLLYGYRYIWQNPKAHLERYKVLADNWRRYWTNEPVDIVPNHNGAAAPYSSGDSIRKYKKPLEFYKAESDPDIGYIANYSFSNAESQTKDEAALLYVTKNNGASWKNISPPENLAGGYIPRHIEIDHKRPERVWMALGLQGEGTLWNQMPAQRTKRVLYCPDAFAEPSVWQDVSKGLPPLPINRLIYQHGSDDVIFAGTDGGVFRWNKALQQWECFMEGMPQSVVTDLEIQYCSGKLKAATYGRGIWETDLEPEMNSFDKTAPYYEQIDFTKTWSESRSLTGGIRIKSGVTFTIDGATVYMPRNSKIHLEKGATLVLKNGALLTNDCDGSVWAGIEMYGNNQVSQANVGDQSKVIVRDNSTIRHARIGIADYSAEYWNSGGGIIDIDGGNFENCYRALAFNDYPKFNNVSKIVDAHVWVDDGYKLTSARSRDFITVFNENAITIDKCTLEDKRTFAPQVSYADQLFNGIYVARGGVNVKRSLFKRLTSGIKNDADIITASFNTVIDLNRFNDVKEAITQGGNYTDVKNNTISGMAAAFFSNNPQAQAMGKVTGIYLDGTVLAYLHNNGMVFSPSLVATYGVVSNGSKFQNLIRMTDNRVDKAFAGIQTQRYNRYFQTLCNALNSNRYAFSINPQSPEGDFAHQGQGFGTNDWRPRNSFVNNDVDVYFNIGNSSSLVPVKYYVKSLTNPSPKIPANITGPYAGNFDVVINNTGNDNTCYYEDGTVMMGGRMPSGIVNVNGAVTELRSLANANQRMSARAVELYSFIIDTLYRSVNPLDYSNDLIAFLRQDKTDMSRNLLIGHYHIHNDSVSVNRYIDSLEAVTADDKQAYAGYLALQRSLKGQYGSDLAIPFDSVQASPFFAAHYQDREDFIGELARNWVASFGQGIRGEPYIEGIAEAGGRPHPLGADQARPKLLMVSPNPAHTQVKISISLPPDQDGGEKRIEILNALGKTVYQSKKQDTEPIEVNVEGWAPGMYTITLYQNGKAVSTERVSIVK